MKSLFLSRSRVKPQKDSINEPKFSKATFLGNISDKKRGPHKKEKKGINTEIKTFNWKDDIACRGDRRAWTAPPSNRSVIHHKASDNERSSSEYNLRLSGLQNKNNGHRFGLDNPTLSPSCDDQLDQEFETESHHQNSNKRSQRDTSFSSWFGPTLKYVFDAEKDDRNEIRVLALGIQQFIDEIFDALDRNKKGYVPFQDVAILCSLLGKNLPSRDVGEKCTKEICMNESCEIHIHYSDFKQKMQSLFESDERNRNVSDYRNNDKLIETVAKVSRRTNSLKYIAKLLEEVENKVKSFYATGPDGPYKGHSLIGLDKNRNQRESKMCLKNLDLQRQILLQLQELQCLREIVEDFRVALQTSDAENLALRVSSLRDKQCKKCASDESNLRHLSFPNEDDSIDRLIINFPSSEALQASDPNLPTFYRAEGVATSSSQNLMDSQFRNLLDKSYEDLDIQYELEEVYRELFEAKEKISELKLSLDRNKTRELTEAAFQLNRMSEEVAEATEAKKMLEEEIQRCGKNLEERNTENETLLEELKGLKEKYETTTNELEEVKENFKQTKKLRRQELKQFKDLRKLLVDALSATRDSQMSQNNDTTQSTLAPILFIGSKDGLKEGVSNKQYTHPSSCPKYSSMAMTSECPGKRKLDHDSRGQDSIETYDNVDSSELYRMKLRRGQPLQEEMEYENPVYESGEERPIYGNILNSSIDKEKDGYHAHRKKVRNDVKSRSNGTRILPSTDTKPVLEVKPNIIKPWISLDQPPKAVEAEIYFDKENVSYGPPLSVLNDLEIAKVSSDLCKEITETFSILNETMDSCGSTESYGSMESSGSSKSHCSLVGFGSCNSVLSDSGNYSFDDFKEIGSKITRSENNEENKMSIKQAERRYDVYENSENYQIFNYEIPGFEENSIPFKSSTRSSTQILESLEFEVDLLRKSLEEDNLWR